MQIAWGQLSRFSCYFYFCTLYFNVDVGCLVPKWYLFQLPWPQKQSQKNEHTVIKRLRNAFEWGSRIYKPLKFSDLKIQRRHENAHHRMKHQKQLLIRFSSVLRDLTVSVIAFEGDWITRLRSSIDVIGFQQCCAAARHFYLISLFWTPQLFSFWKAACLIVRQLLTLWPAVLLSIASSCNTLCLAVVTYIAVIAH